jgi:hypothetical protein
VNRTVHELTASDFEILDPRFWEAAETYGARPKVFGSLKPLRDGRDEQLIPPGKEGDFKHEIYLSPETTTMLRDLFTRHAEIHYDMTLNWRLRFTGEDHRWGTRGTFVECPKQSHERQ